MMHDLSMHELIECPTCDSVERGNRIPKRISTNPEATSIISEQTITRRTASITDLESFFCGPIRVDVDHGSIDQVKHLIATVAGCSVICQSTSPLSLSRREYRRGNQQQDLPWTFSIILLPLWLLQQDGVHRIRSRDEDSFGWCINLEDVYEPAGIDIRITADVRLLGTVCRAMIDAILFLTIIK